MRVAIVLGLACALGLAACASGSGWSSLPTPPLPPGLASCAPDDGCPPTPPLVMAAGEQVPVYKTIYEPIYEERRTPVWGEKTVPVYQTRKIPVTIRLPDACTGCERDVHLWDREQEVQVGVRRVPACIGYKTERIVVGRCPKQVRVGWRTVAEEPSCP